MSFTKWKLQKIGKYNTSYFLLILKLKGRYFILEKFPEAIASLFKSVVCQCIMATWFNHDLTLLAECLRKLPPQTWQFLVWKEKHITYIHNWSLQPFSWDYEQASHSTYNVSVNFIHKRGVLQFKADHERVILQKLFMAILLTPKLSYSTYLLGILGYKCNKNPFEKLHSRRITTSVLGWTYSEAANNSEGILEKQRRMETFVKQWREKEQRLFKWNHIFLEPYECQ